MSMTFRNWRKRDTKNVCDRKRGRRNTDCHRSAAVPRCQRVPHQRTTSLSAKTTPIVTSIPNVETLFSWPLTVRLRRCLRPTLVVRVWQAPDLRDVRVGPDFLDSPLLRPRAMIDSAVAEAWAPWTLETPSTAALALVGTMTKNLWWDMMTAFKVRRCLAWTTTFLT